MTIIQRDLVACLYYSRIVDCQNKMHRSDSSAEAYDYDELRHRNRILTEQNNKLKASLEDLIRVNNELTREIQELIPMQQPSDENTKMASENEILRRQIENLRSKSHRERQSSNQASSEALALALEELTESFQGVVQKYESHLQTLNNHFNEYRQNYEVTLARLQSDYQKKLETLESLFSEMKKREDEFQLIQRKVATTSKGPTFAAASAAAVDHGVGQRGTNRDKELEVYRNLVRSLKEKLNEKL